ncbi:hypothetical protein [Gorillibacterium sp. sgz5001074]|uniref:hypothetical protein n=1 Tax=Gorillibacterium sp. sgz5001074 TaxID=3446695 RepID=UPI003F66C138
MERRYFFYLFSVNQITNIGMFVPVFLVRHRFQGSITGILTAVLVGTLLVAAYLKLSERLPLLTLPELLDRYMPSWAAWGSKLLMLVIFYWVGLITLMTFDKVASLFLNPGVSEYAILTLYLLLVLTAAQIPSKSILMGLEVLLIINVPLLAGFCYKLFTDVHIEPDGVVDIFTHMGHMPELETVAAAAFVFSGYANMMAFQKSFAKPVGFRHFWIVPLAGLLSLGFCFLVPVLYHGTMGIEIYSYPFTSTADSVRMELFIIERMLFIYLFIYISICLFSIIVHWHVSLTAFNSMISSVAKLRHPWSFLLPLLLYAAPAYAIVGHMSYDKIIEQSRLFMLARFFSEFVMIGVLGLMAWRRAKE